jgi:hypothetical protein
MNTDSSPLADRLADFSKACNVALDGDNEDCVRDQFVILGSETHQQHPQEEEYGYEESVLEYDEDGRHYNHHQQQHYNDMSPTGIVFLIVLAVALGVCAVCLYKYHNLHHQQEQEQAAEAAAGEDDDGALQEATETTTQTTEPVSLLLLLLLQLSNQRKPRKTPTIKRRRNSHRRHCRSGSSRLT